MSKFWDKVKHFLGMEISLTEEKIEEVQEKPKRKRAPAKRKSTRKRKSTSKKPRSRKKVVKEEVTEFEKPLEAEIATIDEGKENVEVVQNFSDTTILTDTDKDDKVS